MKEMKEHILSWVSNIWSWLLLRLTSVRREDFLIILIDPETESESQQVSNVPRVCLQ